MIIYKQSRFALVLMLLCVGIAISINLPAGMLAICSCFLGFVNGRSFQRQRYNPIPEHLGGYRDLAIVNEPTPSDKHRFDWWDDEIKIMLNFDKPKKWKPSKKVKSKLLESPELPRLPDLPKMPELPSAQLITNKFPVTQLYHDRLEVIKKVTQQSVGVLNEQPVVPKSTKAIIKEIDDSNSIRAIHEVVLPDGHKYRTTNNIFVAPYHAQWFDPEGNEPSKIHLEIIKTALDAMMKNKRAKECGWK